jgi:hypothetical protein
MNLIFVLKIFQLNQSQTQADYDQKAKDKKIKKTSKIPSKDPFFTFCMGERPLRPISHCYYVQSALGLKSLAAVPVNLMTSNI